MDPAGRGSDEPEAWCELGCECGERKRVGLVRRHVVSNLRAGVHRGRGAMVREHLALRGAPDVADGDGDGCEPRLREVKLVGGPYDVGVMAEWTCKLSCCTRRCLWVMAFVSTDLVDMRALACRYPSP